MIHIVNVSGGKDSGAVLAWAKNNLPHFKAVTCDTDWESDTTYQYIQYLETWLGQPITVLRSLYGFADLARKKGRFPSRKAQFCTELLKVQPAVDHILTLTDDVTIYCGKRREESDARRFTPKQDDYLKPDLYKYRTKEVRKWLESYTADVFRPIVDWPVADVFTYAAMYGQLPNPLYLLGFSRVGCFPCINARHSEIRLVAQHSPEKIQFISELEEEIGSTFYGPGYIPAAFCSKHVQTTSKKTGLTYGTWVPTIKDVVRYVTEHRQQVELFPVSSCQSVYGLCE